MSDDRRKGRPDVCKDETPSVRRRNDRRRDARVSINIWVEEFQGDDLYFQQAGNLSVGGVFFERTIPHPTGTQVKLRFSLPDSDGVIETVGEVVSERSDVDLGAGVRFLNLDPVEEQLIRAYVNKHKD